MLVKYLIITMVQVPADSLSQNWQESHRHAADCQSSGEMQHRETGECTPSNRHMHSQNQTGNACRPPQLV
jgi:hypothetical protein